MPRGTYLKPSLKPYDFKNGDNISDLVKIGIDLGDVNMVTAFDAVDNIGTPIEFLRTQLPGFVANVTQSLRIDRIVGATIAGNWSDEEIIQGVLERRGEVGLYGDLTASNLQDFEFAFDKRTVVRFEDGIRVGLLEKDRASRAGLDSTTTKRNTALRNLDIIRNAVGFRGYQTGANKTYGFLNDPGLPASVAVATVSGVTKWVDKSVKQISDDIVDAVNDLVVSTGSNFDPYADDSVFVVPSSQYQFLNKQNDFGRSALIFIKENYPKMRIEIAPEFDGAFNTNENGFYLYAERENQGDSTDSGLTFEQIVPAKIKMLGLDNRAKHFDEHFSNATAGVMCKRPYNVIIRTGI